MTATDKFAQSLAALEHALTFENKIDKDAFYYAGIAKSYEVSFEYAWKFMRQEVLDAGLEANSPRDAIKLAGQIGLIGDVEEWLNFLRARNIAVHDYIGITKEDYLRQIKQFLLHAQKIIKRK